MKRTIITITSYDRCGKDFVASRMESMLVKNGYRCRILHFSDALKDFVGTVLGLPIDKYEKMLEHKDKVHTGVEMFLDNGDEKEFYRRRVRLRDLLINVSKDLRRKYGEDFFVNFTIDEIDKDNKTEVFIIPDLRFGVEYRGLRKYVKDKLKKVHLLRYKDLKMHNVFLESHLESCGKNGKRYELDYIAEKIEHTIRNDSDIKRLDTNIELLLKRIGLL